VSLAPRISGAVAEMGAQPNDQSFEDSIGFLPR